MTWDDFLDEYEARLSSAEASLASGEPFDDSLLQPYESPQGLGQFPYALVPRATAILDRNIALTESISSAMSAVRNQLNIAQKETSAARGYAPVCPATVSKFFDQPA